MKEREVFVAARELINGWFAEEEEIYGDDDEPPYFNGDPISPREGYKHLVQFVELNRGTLALFAHVRKKDEERQ